METPNGIVGKVTSGSGNTAEQAEFENGAQLKREGKELPPNASASAKRGYDSAKVEVTTPAAPGVSKEDADKHLVSHRTPVTVNTDRPEPTTLASDAEPLNPNEGVTITVNEPGKEYLVEGLGASTKISFADVTEESLIAVLIDRLEGPKGVGAGDQYAKNAADNLHDALKQLQARVKDKLARFGVTQPSSLS